MEQPVQADDRLLSAAERELVEATEPAALEGQSLPALRALGARLREARDRARGIARGQQREMRGKAAPRGATPARENAGSVAKTEVLVAALARVAAAQRALAAPTQAELARKAMAAKQGAPVQPHPGGGPTAGKGVRVKASQQPTVRMDPREVGRVSQAGKQAQARRDGAKGR